MNAGKRRDFAGYKITQLGRIIYRIACSAGMHRQRFELSRLRLRLETALSKDPGW